VQDQPEENAMKKKLKKLNVSRETLRSLHQVAGGIAPATNAGCDSMKETCGEVTCMFGFCYTNSCPDWCIGGEPYTTSRA
jgi:hypothetical protein